MQFDPHQFQEKINFAVAKGLPGKDAQYLMAPFRRQQREIESLAKDASPRLGGVLVYLFPDSSTQDFNILLTQRQEYQGVHSGQISFPGGKKEPEDPDILTTAFREAKEETGVVIHNNDLVSPMTELYIPPSNFYVFPHLAVTEVLPSFRADPVEVKKIISLSVTQLLDERIVKSSPMQLFNNMTVDVPYFEVDGHKVWGATAMILSELKQILIRVL